MFFLQFLKKLRQYLLELEKFIDQQKDEEPIDIQNVSMEDWSKGQFGFGNFKISAFKWPSTADRNKVKDVFFFHKNDAKNNKNKNNKNNKNDEFFKQFIAFFAQINDEIKGKMAERWSHLDGMIDIQVGQCKYVNLPMPLYYLH
jgi:sarcosine oxidase delta subunit